MADVLRVLYVDDEPGLLEISKLFLEKVGAFSVDTVPSAKEALIRLNTERYDAIISDYLMPEMDGIMFLVELRVLGNTTPFIIFTGRGREEVVIEALNEGADFYIQKGGDPESQYVELAHKIRSAVSRQRTENQAKDTERRLHDITNFLPDATFAIDKEGFVIAWNRAIEEMTGVPANDMLGKGNYEYSVPFYGERRPILIDLVSIPDDERTTGRYSNIKREGSIITAETSLPRPSGRYSVLMGRASVLYNSKGDVIGAIESIRDITEQKRNEESLGESGQKYRTVIEQSNDGIFIAQDGLLVFHNPSFATLTGYSSADLYGRSIADLIAPEDRDLVLTRHRERSAGKALPEEYEFSVLHHDGTTRIRVIMHISSASVGGRPATIGTLHNVTEERRREEALRVSEEKYRSVIENIQDMFYRSDREGNLIMASPSCIRKLGYGSIDEIINKPISETFYISPEKRKEMVRIIDEKGFIEDSEVQLKRKDGSPLWVTSSSHHYRDENGMIAGIEGIFHDISERKLADKALRESELLFREVFNNANDAVFLLERTPDGPGNYLLVNDKAVRMLGYSEEELLAMSPRDIVPDEFHKKIMPGIIKKLLKDEHATFESSHRRKDGSIYPVEVSTHTFRYMEKDVDLSIVRDITERKRAEESERESEVRYRTVFENAGDAIAVHDLEGNFVEVNNVICRRFGYSREELLTMKVADVDDPVHARNVEGLIRELTKKGHIFFETVHITRDGRQISEEVSAVLINLGNKPHVMSIARDITERKELEKEMEHHAQELRKFSTSLASANKKFTLLSSVTRHDINNQLAMLRGYLAILEDSKPAPSQEEYFRKASAAAQRISAMIHFTKEYEQIGVNSPVWQDLRTLVETASKQTQLGKINVKNELPGGAEVFADPLIIKVFYNLMDNAVRYGGDITTIRFSVEEHDSDHILICEDDGPGVTSEEKEKIFDREFGKNTGLGLFLSREILDITGITITETGEPGRGARFEMVVLKDAWRIDEADRKQD